MPLFRVAMSETLSPITSLPLFHGVADAYWRAKLYQGERAINLPFDIVQKSGDGFHFAKVERRLEPGIEPLMESFSQEMGRSLSDLWEALVLALLIGYGQESNVVTIGSAAEKPSKRPRCEDPIADLILGFVSGTEILQTESSPSLTLRSLLEEDGAITRSTPSHELLAEMAGEDISKLRPAMSVVYGEYPASRISSAGCDLAFSWSEESGLALQYNTFRISRGGANRIMGHLVTLAAWLSTDPDRPIVDLEFLTENERESLTEWNSTERLSDFRGRTIYQLFEARFEMRPATTALVDGQGNASYRALNDRVDLIAQQLRSLGASPGQNIAICAERTSDLVATFLAVWKIGAVAVPVDRGASSDRVRKTLQVLQPVVWVHDQSPPLRESTLKLLNLERLRTISKRDADSGNAVSILPDATAFVLVSDAGLEVKISHRALINRMAWFWRVYPFRIGQIAYAQHSISSIHFIYELLVPLLEGIPVVLADQQTATEPRQVLKQLASNRVSRMTMDVAMVRLLMDAIQKDEELDLLNLRHCFSYGEIEPEDLLKFQKWIPDANLVGFYGALETAGISTAYDTAEAADVGASIPAGKPIDNSRTEVRNREGKLVPLGVWGQVWFGGLSIAKDYSGAPEAEAGSFRERDGKRWFVDDKPGRWMPSGNLEISLDPQAELRPLLIMQVDTVDDTSPAEPIDSPEEAVVKSPRSPKKRVREIQDGEVASIWGQILGGVPSDQNLRFSELGGDIEGLGAMVIAFSHQLKRKVSFKEVMARETIAELQEFLKSYDDSLSNWSGLIPINEGGEKTPIVFFHDFGLGALSTYAKVAANLHSDRPVFIITSRGLSGFEEFGDVRSMASHYVSELKKQFGELPILLGGLHFGGRVAIEVARQMMAVGRSVPLVFLMESTPKFNSIGRKWLGALSRETNSNALNLPTKYRDVSGVLRRVKRVVSAQRVIDAEHFDEEYSGNVALIRLAAPKALFRAESSDLGWSKCVSGDVQTLSVEVVDSINAAAEGIGQKIESVS